MKCLLFYSSKPTIDNFLPHLKKTLQKYSISLLNSFLIDKEKKITCENFESDISHSDFIICLGGDGTILRLKNFLEPLSKPILPLHFGRLGFITNTSPEDIESTIVDFIEHQAFIEPRMLLSTLDKVALNEILIKGTSLNHTIGEFKITINSFSPIRYKCDGIIVSTPTGSTAHSLSAGGPIVYPTLNSIIILPLAAHNLTSRPIVLPADITIKIEILRPEPQTVSCDGEYIKTLQQYESIFIQKSKTCMNFIYPKNRNYYQSLQKKLNWLS